MSKRIKLKTMSNEILNVKSSQIKSFSLNFVTIKFTTEDLNESGLFRSLEEYELTPESLNALLKFLEETDQTKLPGENTAYGFLKVISTTEDYINHLKKYEDLPKDDLNKTFI